MNEDNYYKEWLKDPITIAKINYLRFEREAHLKALLDCAQQSTDPRVQEHAVSIRVIARILGEIISETMEEME